MTLHDRIMHEADRHNIDTDHGCGYVDGMTRSATLAKEADELMAEMAKELEISCECKYGDCIICDVLQKYKTYKEQN